MVSQITRLRVLSLLATTALAALIPDKSAFKTVIFAIGFGHYLLGFFYSGNRIRRALGRLPGLLPLFGIAALGNLLYLSDLPLFFYFAIHHAFNEAYLFKRPDPSEPSPGPGVLRAGAALFHLFLYFFVLRNSEKNNLLDPLFLGAGLAASAAFLLAGPHRLKPFLSREERADHAALPVMGLLLAGLSFFIHITFLQIVAYHLVFWFLYPLSKIVKQTPSPKKGGAASRYLGWTALCTAPFFLFSPMSALPWRFSHEFFLWLFRALSFAHITASFALSDAQPGWITRWFREKPALPSEDGARLKLEINELMGAVRGADEEYEDKRAPRGGA